MSDDMGSGADFGGFSGSDSISDGLGADSPGGMGGDGADVEASFDSTDAAVASAPETAGGTSVPPPPSPPPMPPMSVPASQRHRMARRLLPRCRCRRSMSLARMCRSRQFLMQAQRHRMARRLRPRWGRIRTILTGPSPAQVPCPARRCRPCPRLRERRRWRQGVPLAHRPPLVGTPIRMGSSVGGMVRPGPLR